jgi:Zn-dependent protease with chaperone function
MRALAKRWLPPNWAPTPGSDYALPMADAASFRAEGDKRLYAELLAEARVREAMEVVKSSALEGHVPAVRRALLARSLRLPPTVQPELHAIVASCRERLGVWEPVECYVNPSSEYNAGIFPRQDGRLYILFTAALLESFDRDELRFVVGHELGHHVYGHHEVPIAVLFDQRFPISPELALRLTAWQRYAEVSADRAGVACSGGFDGAARGLFKLASGLHQAPTNAQIVAFLEQAKELGAAAAEPGRAYPEEWFSSHPFSPLRVQAAHLFSRSVFMRESGEPASRLETGIAALMAMMEPGYLHADTEAAEAMRRLIYAAGLVLLSEDGGVTPEEKRRLDTLLGSGSAPLDFDPHRIAELLPERTRAVVERTGIPQRAHVLRDLATLALADGKVSVDEQTFLTKLAADLEVDVEVVTNALSQKIELD